MYAVVLAAGEGSRTTPLTLTRPKVMLPVGNRPILEHVMAALHGAEIRDVVVVVGYKAESVQAHFQDGNRFGMRIQYVHQKTLNGTADAFKRGLEKVPKGEDVIVVPGDNYLGPEVIHRFLQDAGPKDALLYTSSTQPERYGVVELHDERVGSVSEKPSTAKGDVVSTGIAKVSRARADRIKKHASDAQAGFSKFLTEIASSATRLIGVPLVGRWFDVDHPQDLLGANALHLARIDQRVEGVVEPGASVLGQVSIGSGTRIRSGSYVVGPVVIGEGCEIGPHTVVYGPAVIGDNVTVGPFTELLECVVMEDGRIASGCTLHHAVLDRAVSLAPRVSMDRAHGTAGAEYGAVVGDGSILGNNVFVCPGSVLGRNVRVAPEKRIGNLPTGTMVV